MAEIVAYEDESEDRSIEEIFEAFLLRYATVREMKNKHVELATFIRRFFILHQFWIEGELTYWKLARGWLIYTVSNTEIIVTICHMVRVTILTKEFHLGDYTTNLTLIIALPLGFYLFQTLYLQQKGWQALVLEMGNFEVYEKPPDLEVRAAMSDVLIKITLLIIFLPVPFLAYYIITANCPDPEDYACGIMFPAYFPGCMGRFRPICGLVHLATAYSIAYIGYLSSCFYSQLSEFIVIYLQYFQTMLKKIPTIENWDERWAHMNMTLKYHQRILELYETYYFLVKDAFLIHIFGTPVVLAVLIYTFLTDFRIQNVAHSLLWVFSLSYVCFFGQRMVDESENVVEIAYQSIPFDGDNRTARALLFLIHRSQKTMHTPAGTLTYCGKSLFVAVMKTMYSYLTVMQSTGAVNKEVERLNAEHQH